MKRREFLKLTAGAALGTLLPQLWTREALAADWEPPIYRRFFRFSEAEERKSTDVIVIHHSGVPGKDADTMAALIHEYHQQHNGWAGIGYHYLIRKDGMIEQGRRRNTVGAHTYDHNKNSIGICLAGNFEIGKPTEAQMAAVKELATWLCLVYNLDPEEKGRIVGHRDLNDDTACPGKNLYARLDEIRAAVKRG